MPYASTLDEGRLDMIDAFWCRCRADYVRLTARYGAKHVFHIPDLALLNPIPHRKTKATGRRLGLALSMSLVKGPCRAELLGQVRNLIQRLLSMGYEVNWLAFNTDASAHESDVELYYALPAIIQRQVPLYTEGELLSTLVEMDLVIASRFHAHVFSWLANIPVVSLVLTRKVEQWNEDHGWKRNSVTLPRTCKWCRPSIVCESCKGFVGHVTSVPVGEICNTVRSLRAVNYNTKKDIATLREILDSILQTPWKLRASAPYFVVKDNVVTVVQRLTSSWERFVAGTLTAEDLTAITCLCITGDPRHSFAYGLGQQLLTSRDTFDFPASVEYMVKTHARENEDWCRHLVSSPTGVFSLSKVPQHRLVGQHRAGWEYVVDQLSTLHNEKAPLMDTFLDRTFGWDAPYYEALETIPYTQPWMGFLHHPPQAVFSDNDCSRMIKNPAWQASLPHCTALFVLASDLKVWLREQGVTVPIHVLQHPTDHQVPQFTWSSYQKNPKRRVIQVGAWLRDPYAMFRLHVSSLQKTVLKCKDMDGYILDTPPQVLPSVYADVQRSDLPIYTCDKACRDGNGLHPFLASVQHTLQEQWRSVSILNHVSNEEFDKLLTENIVFLPLLKAEAVNSILDCIVRNTPVIVSHLPAVVEYLGPGYPGYFRDYAEAESKIDNPEVVKACYQYLQRMDKTFLTSEYFLTHLRASLASE